MKKEHILVIRFSALGDVAMTVPVVWSLAHQYPDVRITVLSRISSRPLFEGLAPNVGFMGGHYSFNNAIRLDSLGNPDVFSVDRIYKTTIYEIPIMLKMVTNELGNAPVRIYAQVGAGLGLVPQKVRVKDAIPADGIVTPDKWSITNKEYSLFRTSLKIGAGAQYALDESTRLFAGFYFSHDFINNINHWSPNYAGKYYDENGEKVGDRDTKLNVLQNRVGFEMGVLF